MTDPFNATLIIAMLAQGQIIEGILMPFTAVMTSPLFYGIMVFMAMTMIYMKTQNFTTTAIVGMLVAGSVMSILPTQVRFIGYTLLALGVATTLYKGFHG